MSEAGTRPMGVVYDMPFDQYLQIDALSASGLRVLARSAWHYKHRGNIEPTPQMLRGTLAHCAVLEPDALASRYIVVPDDAPRRPTAAQWAAKSPSADSKAAMGWWREFQQRAQGRQIVPAADYAITQQQLRAVSADPTIAAILRQGRSEVSVFWVDAATGIYCKARPDHIGTAGGFTVLDLKSTADESPSGFGRSAARMKYHLQQAHYIAGVEDAMRRKVDAFVFAAVTSAPPVLAVPYILTDELQEQAEDERRELLELYARCKESDEWPAYGAGLQLLDFPAYAKRSGEVEIEWAE